MHHLLSNPQLRHYLLSRTVEKELESINSLISKLMIWSTAQSSLTKSLLRTLMYPNQAVHKAQMIPNRVNHCL